MRRILALFLTTVLTLGCSGLFTDSKGLVALDDSLTKAYPESAPILFLHGAAESGVMNPWCTDGYQQVANAPIEMRQVLLAKMLWSTTCPTPCLSETDAATFAKIDASEQMDFVSKTCTGPEPIFKGELAPLATHAQAMLYLATRLAFERSVAAGMPDSSSELLAIGLAVNGFSADQRDLEGPFKVNGAKAKWVAKQLKGKCTVAMEARVVVDPTGRTRAFLGNCGEDSLRATKWPAGAWRVVDITGKLP